jgi:hypothetical protein
MGVCISTQTLRKRTRQWLSVNLPMALATTRRLVSLMPIPTDWPTQIDDCALCGLAAVTARPIDQYLVGVRCNRCGEFLLTDQAWAFLVSAPEAWRLAILNGVKKAVATDHPRHFTLQDLMRFIKQNLSRS